MYIMPATRTQIYLTEAQRRRLDEICRLRGVSLAEAVREAVDAWVTSEHVTCNDALDQTFGAAPQIEVPARDEWERGHDQWPPDLSGGSPGGPPGGPPDG